MFDQFVSGLCFAFVRKSFHDNDDPAWLQRGADMAQHGLMRRHLVIGVGNQCGVNIRFSGSFGSSSAPFITSTFFNPSLAKFCFS